MHIYQESGWQHSIAPMPDQEALGLLSAEKAYRANILPQRVEGRSLVCLGSEPLNVAVIRRIELDLSREIRIIPTAPGVVRAGLELAYGPERAKDVHEIVEAVAKVPKRPNPCGDLTEVSRRNSGPTKVIAVTSGKGGVGKSSITANLGIALADLGHRVGIIDCDFGLSNLHILFGARPDRNLGDVLARRAHVGSAFFPVHRGLHLLAGHAGAADYADLDYAALQHAGAGFEELNSAYDFLLLDTGAGVHHGVLSLMEASDEIILVTTPDPSAVLDAYVAARTLLSRKPDSNIKVLANEVKNESQAKEIYAKFMTFIGLNTNGRAEFLGKVQSDKSIVEAGRSRRPVLLHAPKSQAARDLQAIACRMSQMPLPSHLDAAASPVSRWLGRLAA